MFTLITVCILVFSLVLLRLDFIKLAYFIFTCLTILFFSVASGLLPDKVLTELSTEIKPSNNTVWSESNILILLGGGRQYSRQQDRLIPSTLAYVRILKTANEYFKCKKQSSVCKILISGGGSNQTGASEAAVYANSLSQINVSRGDIITETQSRNTFENAKFVQKILENQTYKQQFLITSAFHMRRSILYFKHFSMNPRPIITEDLLPSENFAISKNFLLMDLMLHEYIGILRYYMYEYFDWNKD